MRRCPHCGAENPDPAATCLRCGLDLPLEPPAPSGDPAPTAGGVPAAPPAPAPPGPEAGVAPGPPGAGALAFSHSGDRFVLGYGADFFGIWDRAQAGGPVARFPRTDEGWAEAWRRYAAWEPRAVPVAGLVGARPAPPAASPWPASRAEPYRPGGVLARTLVGLLAASGLVALLGTFVQGPTIARLHMAAQQGTGLGPTPESQVSLVGALGGLLSLATIVVWLVWQYRAHANLAALGSVGMRHTPGWTVGWWFIPIADLWMPLVVMRELWRASDPVAGPTDWTSSRGSPLIGWWWATWLAPFAAGFIAAAIAASATGTATAADAWAVVGGILRAASAVLAVALVVRIEARQRERRARGAPEGRGGPRGAADV